MPTIVQTFHGKVTGLWGSASIRGADGKMHPLKMGDLVNQGDVILTSQDGIVRLNPADEETVHAAATPASQPDIDRVISDLNQPDPKDPTAAGLSGGDGAGDLTPGLRVDRIVETTTPASPAQSGDFDRVRLEPPATVAQAAPAQSNVPAPIGANSGTIDATEEGPSVNLGLSAPTGASSAAVIMVTQIPLIGELHKADGTLVTTSSVLTAGDLAGLTYVPPADYDGVASVGEFTYTVADHGATATGSVVVDLSAVNDTPIAMADVGSAIQSVALNVSVAAGVLSNDTDADAGDTKTVSAVALGAVAGVVGAPLSGTYGTLTLNGDGSYSYLADKPAAQALTTGQTVSEQFTYTTVDAHGASSSATLTISIAGTNDAPVAAADGAMTMENTPVVVSAAQGVLANDSDPDAGSSLTVIQYTIAGVAGSYAAGTTANVAGLGSLVLNADGSYAYTPAPGFHGQAPVVTYTVSDGLGATDTATLTIDVTPDTPPTGADTARTFAEDTSYTVRTADFGFSDVDAGQTLANVRIDALPGAGTLLLSGVAVHAGQVVSAAEIAAGDLVFVPAADANGTPYASFGFSVQDSAGGFDPTPNVLIMNLLPVNDAPVAVADFAVAVEAGGVANGMAGVDPIGNVLSNDTDVDAGDSRHVYMAGAPAAGAYGTLVLNADGSYAYTVDNGAAAVQVLRSAADTLTDTFTYSVEDASGALSTATLTVTIRGANDAPVAMADSGAATEDIGLNVDAANGVLFNDSDVDAGDAKAVSGVAFGGVAGTVGAALDGTYGTLTLNADGSYSYLADKAAAQALSAGQTANEQFTYTTHDAAGASSTATLTISITGTNDAPVAAADVGITPEDTPLATDAAHGLLSNDGDPDTGAALSVTQFSVAGVAGTFAAGSTVTIGGVGTLVIHADGSYNFDPVTGFKGPVPVASYAVSDGSAAADSTLALTVTAVNHPPSLDLDGDNSHNIVAVEAIAGLFNTGEGAGGVALPLGTSDPHYALISAPAGSNVSNTTLELGYSWIPGDADSTWIGSPLTEPAGVYQYQTSFTLQPGADPRSALISFDLASDNNLRDILVNGVSTGISSNVQYGAFTHIDLNGVNAAFHSGVNTITFVVDNRDDLSASTAGPTGLRIDNMSGTVAVIEPSAATHVGDYATVYVEGSPVSIADADIAIHDVDGPNLQGATITLTNAQAGDALLAAGMPAGISATVDATGTVVTLAGTASQASYETAIRAVQFGNTSSDPSGAVDRLITIVVNDGAADSNIATTTVHVVPVNAAPTLDLDGNDSTAAGTGFAGAYTENGAPTRIVDTDVVVGDADSTVLYSATVHITNVQAGDMLSTGALPSGVSAAVYDASGGVLTLSGAATLAEYQAALASIGFSNTSDNPSTLTRTIEISVNDGAAHSNVSVSTIAVGSANDAPTNLTPATQAAFEDTPLLFSNANGNVLAVADVDSPSVTVTLAVSAGALSLGSTAGVAISGNGTGTVTLSGTAAAINNAMDGTAFSDAADHNGAAQLTMTTSDGVAAPVVSTIGIGIAPVADIHSDIATTVENTPVVIDVNANDTFADAGRVVSAIDGHAIAVGASVAVANGSVLLQADGQLLFTPAPGYNTSTGAPTSFSYTVSSGGTTETASVEVNVTGINDAAIPTLNVAAASHWTFDEASGAATFDKYDATSGSLTDSTPSPLAPPLWVAGHAATSGTALHFDGDGSFVALDPTITQPLMGTGSLSFWIKTTQTGSGDSLSWNSPAVISSEENGGGNDIQWGALNASGKIGFGLGNVNGVYSTTSVNDDAWHQVAITRDAATGVVNVFVDGVLEANGSPIDGAFNATLNRLVGFGSTNNFAGDAVHGNLADAQFLNASLDDVRIYDHVLTSDQVAAIQSVEAGYHDLAVANDGDATRLSLTASHYTDLSVSGLNAGMSITDGTAGHTVASAGTDTSIDLTGWNLSSLSVSGAGTGSATLAFNATDTVNGESHTATQYLNIVNGTSLHAGGGGDDTLNGTASADLLVGAGGNDTLNGGDANDRLLGGAGADTLNGGAGNDIVIGGAGHDTLTGGTGADTFAWTLADRGASGAPASDTITDFNAAPASAGGDSLDLRDLLVGANHVGANPGNLQNYLDFDTTSTPGSTVIHISSTGGYSGGNYAAGSEDERITLQGVDLRSALSLDAAASDNQIIHELLSRNKLVTDGA